LRINIGVILGRKKIPFFYKRPMTLKIPQKA